MIELVWHRDVYAIVRWSHCSIDVIDFIDGTRKSACVSISGFDETRKLMPAPFNACKLQMPVNFVSMPSEQFNYASKIYICTFIASSSVVSSPAHITFTVSAQSFPNSWRRIYKAASPLFHWTGGFASMAMCAWFGMKPYDSMMLVALNL